MNRLSLIVCIIFSVPSLVASKNGLVELDEHSFDKILGKFAASLVKFDVAYPYGDKHEAFLALAMEAKEVEDLLVADVNVKDYGDKDNDLLALRYGASKDNFPVVKLFLKGTEEPIPFDESKGFTTDLLRKFVQEHTGLYLHMPGCIHELDLLADKFIQSEAKDRKKVLKELEETQKELNQKHATSGEVYKTIMNKILEKGDEFIKTETDRVKKLINGKVSEEKKRILNTRINILSNFELALRKKNKEVKEDL